LITAWFRVTANQKSEDGYSLHDHSAMTVWPSG
jgi:hypothetical protein